MKPLILILAIVLISCGEYEPNDNLTGNWRYESLDLSGTQPVVKLSFTINEAGESYALDNLTVSIDGVLSSNYSSVVTNPIKGDKIGKITLNNGEAIIELTNLDHLGSYPVWYVEHVRMEIGNEIFTYSGGLKQN